MAMGDRILTRAEELRAQGRQTAEDAIGDDDRVDCRQVDVGGDVEQDGEKVEDALTR